MMVYRNIAEKAFLHAVDSVSPATLISRNLRTEGQKIICGTTESEMDPAGRVFVIGAGKASGAMAAEVERILGERISDGIVAVKYGHSAPLGKIRLREAGHPVPDGNSFGAAAEVATLAITAGANDLVICLISGGGSSLITDTPPGITGDEIASVNYHLVRCGAAIGEINTVRKHLSMMKGGGLASMVYPARLISLILSDVPGDDPGTIASGLTAPDPSTFAEAEAIIKKYEIWGLLPESVTGRITKGCAGLIPETPKPGNVIFKNVTNTVIGSNKIALGKAAEVISGSGLNVISIDPHLAGDTVSAAERIAALADEIRMQRPEQLPAALLFGGETTLRVSGNGTGGRNQHLALQAAILLSGKPGTVLLAAGTDGTDGPTDAAGALVDSSTAVRASDSGIDPSHYLESFDSYNFFRLAGGHVITGPTLTNVMDIVIVIVH